MKFFKNPFFLLFLGVIFFLFCIQIYFITFSYTKDTSTYATLLEGNATVLSTGEKIVLKNDTKQKLFPGDVLQTLPKSLVVIEWGDKSITRLGESSKILIKENFVSEDLAKIRVSFELLKGQTWSNVISILTGDSYFNQEVRGNIAAVRGTVFEANYDDEYIVSHNHIVEVQNKNGEKKQVLPGEQLSLKNFVLQELSQKIQTEFQKLNQKLDAEYIKHLRESFLEEFSLNNPLNLIARFQLQHKIVSFLSGGADTQAFTSYLESVSPEKKQKILGVLSELNQKINFENGEDENLYILKQHTRESLIDQSYDEAYKKRLVEYSVYDLVDMLQNQNISSKVIEHTSQFIEKYQSYIQESDTKTTLKNILFFDPSSLSLEAIQQKFGDLDSAGQKVIHDQLNTLYEFFKK